MAKAEKYILESKNLKMFFKDDFLKKIESCGDIFPVALVFMSKEKGDPDTPKINSIIFNHKNDEEINKNILHVDSENTDLLNKIVGELEKNEK